MLSFAAGAETLGYKVRVRSQTLIQIARDVYKDERAWKDIAYWNGLKPPYSLNVGQVLLLKKPPVEPVPQENLVTGKALESIQPRSSWASVARQIEKDGDGWIYTVNERAPSLMMIARELYGDEHMAREISAWGGFEPNEKLRLGQRLRLKTAPKMAEAEGNAILIQNWQARGNDMMVERLGGALASARPSNAPVVHHKAKPTARQPADTCSCSGETKSADGNSKATSSAAKTTPKSASRKAAPAVSERAAATPGAAATSPSTASSTPTAAVTPAGASVAAASTVRTPASGKGDEKIPTAHKTETYWLGDDAKRLIEVLDQKLRSIKGNQSPPQ
jgi:hypothetical protein